METELKNTSSHRVGSTLDTEYVRVICGDVETDLVLHNYGTGQRCPRCGVFIALEWPRILEYGRARISDRDIYIGD